jgi:hypothetical protein
MHSRKNVNPFLKENSFLYLVQSVKQYATNQMEPPVVAHISLTMFVLSLESVDVWYDAYPFHIIMGAALLSDRK